MRKALLAFSILILFVSSGYAQNNPLTSIVEVSVQSTPGKPMDLAEAGKPAEQIIIRKEHDQFSLIVSRNVDCYVEKRINISLSEWQTAMNIIDKYNLLSWSPELEEGPVYDFGKEGLLIIGESKKELQWEKPLLNPEPFLELRKYLFSLAKDKIKDIQLFY
ncbi:MAG: hypothetical protein WC412_01050 [Candidatus Omnitrophota bacterium]|jgi:hypothetical protein